MFCGKGCREWRAGGSDVTRRISWISPAARNHRTSHEVGINESCPSDTICAEQYEELQICDFPLFLEKLEENSECHQIQKSALHSLHYIHNFVIVVIFFPLLVLQNICPSSPLLQLKNQILDTQSGNNFNNFLFVCIAKYLSLIPSHDSKKFF